MVPVAWVRVSLTGRDRERAIKRAGSGSKDRAVTRWKPVGFWQTSSSFARALGEAALEISGPRVWLWVMPKPPGRRGQVVKGRAIFVIDGTKETMVMDVEMGVRAGG